MTTENTPFAFKFAQDVSKLEKTGRYDSNLELWVGGNKGPMASATSSEDAATSGSCSSITPSTTSVPSTTTWTTTTTTTGC